MSKSVLDELYWALMSDPNNSTQYVYALIDSIKHEINNAYRDGYNDAQYDAGIMIVNMISHVSSNRKDIASGT